MIGYFLRSLRSQVAGGRTLYLLTVFGVALGVASVLCIQILNRNALAAFTGGVRAVSGEADLSVGSRLPVLDETTYPIVLGTKGVASAWPLYRLDVAVDGAEGLFLDVVGMDLLAGASAPEATETPADSAVLTGQGALDGAALVGALTRPGWTALTPTLADERGWAVGDTIGVSSGSRRADLVVGALVDFQALSPLASRKLALMDIAQAQHLLGRRGELHQIDIILAGGADQAIVAARLEERLGPTVKVRSPEQRQSDASALLEAFRLNLTALSLISLFVGGFLVTTSVQAALVRRRREFGLLRCLGTTGGQVLSFILAEAVLLGLLGLLIGVPLGWWAAVRNVEVISATLTNLYLLEEIERLVMPPWLLLLALVMGVGGAVAGALLPALDMSRRDTKALLSPVTLHRRSDRFATPLALGVLASALLAGGWFLLVGHGYRWGGFVLGLVLLAAVPGLAPWLTRRVGGSGRARGLGLKHSLRNLTLRLQSTALAVAGLGVAVAMLTGITLMIGSFRSTLEVWIDTSIRMDVYVTTESWQRAGREAVLGDGIIARLSDFDGVIGTERLRRFRVDAGERRIIVAGANLDQGPAVRRLPLQAGRQETVMAAMRDEGAAVISEPLSRKAGLAIGDTLRLVGPYGAVALPIAGVTYDYSSEAGAALVSLPTLERHFGPGPINNIALKLAEGRDPETAVAAMKAAFAGQPLSIRSNATLRRDILDIFDQTFAVTRILQAMALLIAVCGVSLTLLVSARERVSELALYRALGAARSQIFRIFTGEGLGIGLLGLVLGTVAGVGLAALLIFVINREYFGWTIQPAWPWRTMLWQAGAILLAALAASVYPALRASDVPAEELGRDDR